MKYNGYMEQKVIKDKDILKANKAKFKKYDYDKNGSIDEG